jgi:hypothetical protein
MRNNLNRVAQPPHHLDVGHGPGGRRVLAVTGGKRAIVLAQQHVAACLARCRDQRVLQVVDPAACSRCEHCLDHAKIGPRRMARRRPHGDHHACQRRFRQQHVEIRRQAVERVHQDRLPLLPHVGRVMLARRVDQARDEALERITADEQAEALSIAQMQDAGCRAQQIVLEDLKELVARKVVEDVDELLFRMAARRKIDAANHARRLVAQ